MSRTKKMIMVGTLTIAALPLMIPSGISSAANNPEPGGWYAGDMHVHRSCGGSPETVSSLYNKMSNNKLAVISLLADMGNGEVQNPTTDLPLVNGQDAISKSGRIVHWDGEWHWDATYTQYDHQALGGHIVALGLNHAEQIWQEYTAPILDWVHQHGGIGGFAHMQYLDSLNGDIPRNQAQLNCCIPIEYPVEVALKSLSNSSIPSADFISEDVNGSDFAIQAYYRLLNTGFRPGLAAGTDYPCNGGAALGSLLTYAQVPQGQQLTYGNWINGIKAGKTVVSRNGHSEFLNLKAGSTMVGPGNEINLPGGGGSVPVSVTWTANQRLTGTIELVCNGAVVKSTPATIPASGSVLMSATVTLPKSGWLAARRMGNDGHVVHTAAVFVTVDNAPVRVSAQDANFYAGWMDSLLSGTWNSYFPNSLDAARQRYQAAKEIYQQIATEAGGETRCALLQ